MSVETDSSVARQLVSSRVTSNLEEHMSVSLNCVLSPTETFVDGNDVDNKAEETEDSSNLLKDGEISSLLDTSTTALMAIVREIETVKRRLHGSHKYGMAP